MGIRGSFLGGKAAGA